MGRARGTPKTTEHVGRLTAVAALIRVSGCGCPSIHVAAISAGLESACALLSNGTVECWGWNNAGQLGNGKQTSSRVPVSVSYLSQRQPLLGDYEDAREKPSLTRSPGQMLRPLPITKEAPARFFLELAASVSTRRSEADGVPLATAAVVTEPIYIMVGELID